MTRKSCYRLQLISITLLRLPHVCKFESINHCTHHKKHGPLLLFVFVVVVFETLEQFNETYKDSVKNNTYLVQGFIPLPANSKLELFMSCLPCPVCLNMELLRLWDKMFSWFPKHLSIA